MLGDQILYFLEFVYYFFVGTLSLLWMVQYLLKTKILYLPKRNREDWARLLRVSKINQWRLSCSLTLPICKQLASLQYFHLEVSAFTEEHKVSPQLLTSIDLVDIEGCKKNLESFPFDLSHPSRHWKSSFLTFDH